MAKPAQSAVPWPLIGLLLATLLIRGSVLWALRGNLEQDPDAYREIAENLLRHGEFALGHGENEWDHRPTAYRPPLYPLVLSNLPTSSGRELSLPKVAALHLALGLATVWLTWLTAHRLLVGPGCRTGPAPRVDAALAAPGTARRSVPTLAALLIACDPILLNQQSLVMTETLATFLAILSLWCLTGYSAHPCWFNAALTGGAIGLAILCRPTFLPWLGLLVPAIATFSGPARIAFSWRAMNTGIMALTAAAILSPWAIRNYRLFGKPIASTTHGGYTLYLGNNPSFFRYLTEGNAEVPWKATEMEVFDFAPKGERLSDEKFQLFSWLKAEEKNHYATLQRWGFTPHRELWSDWAAYALAKKTIRENPKAFVYACGYRIRQLWSPMPHKLTADESLPRRLLRYATCIWYLAVYALAAIGIWKLRWNLIKPPWLYGVLLCLAFTAVHTFYWTNLRMRAPLMPVVAMLAASAVLPTRKPLRPSA